MPRLYAMSDLVLRAKRRADLENDTHIGTGEWKALISEQYGDLYSIVAGSGLRYFETEATITANGSDGYDEPEDHLATVGVDRVVNTAGERVELSEIMVQERTWWKGRSGSAAAVYELVDDKLFLYPKPSSGDYRLLYIPQPPDLSVYADADPVDLVTPDGEAFLLWGVTVKAKAKREQDARLAIMERDAARERLADWACNRAFNQPRRRVVESMDEAEFFDPASWRYR